MPSAIDTLTERALTEGVFPGCVVAIVRPGERVIRAYGTLALNGEHVREDTIYDLASVTKSIPVSSLILKLIHDGVLNLSDLVRTWVPELQNDHAATIEDLLRYRVYGARMSDFAQLSAKEITARVFETGFADLPGDARYSNLPAFLLGLIIERASGKSIHGFASETFFEPLNMRHTFFPIVGMPTDVAFSIAPTETEEQGDVLGIVHDESARVFAREGRSVGHAGLFSNAGDIAVFLEALLAGSFPHIVKGAQMGLGWELNKGTFMGSHFGPRTFGKTGFTGTSILCDCDRGVGIVILSNRTYPTRPPDMIAINAFRSAVTEVVFQSGGS